MSIVARRQWIALVVAAAFGAGNAGVADAQTLEAALVSAYRSNPQLNAQRAATRAIDENVSIALSGYRPRISATSSIAENYYENISRVQGANGTLYPVASGTIGIASVGGTVTQTLFNGFQTSNRTRQAEAQVLAAREVLRSTEQQVMLNAVTAYMNLLRDTAILELQRNNVRVLEAQLRQSRDRFNVGEVTRTDVAQSESRLAAGQSSMQLAEANVAASRAAYQQVIGSAPGRLRAGAPVDRFLPRGRAAAEEVARAQHPNVLSAGYNVDAAQFQVKIAEGALLPSVNLQGNVQKNWGSAVSPTVIETLTASVGAQLAVPIYQGGAEYATVRQAKETLGQRRLDLDAAREQARAGLAQTWGALETARAQIESTQAQVRAAEIALNGVREEARVGQRTTLDVLNAQQELVNARVALVTAQRDRVVNSYATLVAVGRLSPQVLGLSVSNYDPVVHYNQVRDAWTGLRTPDGR
ncbi:MAG TPA: TolC family outer membrane protein [Xanthobacteraceae bacterium]|nr:TolC family outer membrane protein [Xanthobacteraceae bacterium]